MTLKEQLDKMWAGSPCQVPLELCQWRDEGFINYVLVTQLYNKIRLFRHEED